KGTAQECPDNKILASVAKLVGAGQQGTTARLPAGPRAIFRYGPRAPPRRCLRREGVGHGGGGTIISRYALVRNHHKRPELYEHIRLRSVARDYGLVVGRSGASQHED